MQKKLLNAGSSSSNSGVSTEKKKKKDEHWELHDVLSLQEDYFEMIPPCWAGVAGKQEEVFNVSLPFLPTSQRTFFSYGMKDSTHRRQRRASVVHF